MKDIPLSRLILYFVIATVLPFVCVGTYYWNKKGEWEGVYHRILSVHSLSQAKARKQSMNGRVRQVYAEASPLFIQNQLESLSFLNREQKALEQLMNHPSYTGNEGAEKRYAFLAGGKNRLQFSEGNVLSGEGFQESVEVLSHPVEIDSSDLKEILSQIEEPQSKQPQLLITDFKLTKKEQVDGGEVFELDLKLLKREFVK